MTQSPRCLGRDCKSRLQCSRYTDIPSQGESYNDYDTWTGKNKRCAYQIDNGMRWHRHHRIIQRGDSWEILEGKYKGEEFSSFGDAVEYIETMTLRIER
tara:strand:- start:27 stop:323 length:297 start_codon:yes stop_codon:yes gene_type:complete